MLAGQRPPAPPKDPDAPVTQEELHTLRRWVVVAGVWAVAATAVALIALLDNSGRAAERRATQTGHRVAAAETRVDRRVAALDTRLRRLPTTAQVEQLRSQVTQAQRSAQDASDASKGTGGKLSALEKRVASLEGGGGGGGSGNNGGGGPSLRDLFP